MLVPGSRHRSPVLSLLRRIKSIGFFWVILAGFYANTASAGSICGTVRDAQTLAPVVAAGIFLYQSDTYTGFHGATDAGGSYCVLDVLPGIYDISVRVDDFQTAWISGVEIPDDVTAADFFSSTPVEFDAPWPNPSSDQIFLRFRLGEAIPVRLLVYDLRGRIVRGWQGGGATGSTELRWDFRDDTGRTVASGLYYVKLFAGKRVLTRPLVHLR